ncbi:MAG TPA: serine/threonine-protein kinase, partial [Gemmatimonadota bacterium]|nr:serine/threonine-protein kinase [Gemmatimonadota bacterium]
MERRLTSAVGAAASDALGGAHAERIGRYTVIRVLGEGGMGTVYAARQEEPVRRDVAIKVIRPGMHAPDLVARFRAERQTLATLQHPTIAELYEAGTTDDGLPYFAMEWIHGEPVTAYCERRGLDLQARIRLFRTLLGAVQHAHQKTLVHRDLKPSNVLVAEVDGHSVLKVIDFGVARVTTGDAGLTGPTGPGQGIGTLEYISPECLLRHGHQADTRSDIYSLGVLLYAARARLERDLAELRVAWHGELVEPEPRVLPPHVPSIEGAAPHFQPHRLGAAIPQRRFDDEARAHGEGADVDLEDVLDAGERQLPAPGTHELFG